MSVQSRYANAPTWLARLLLLIVAALIVLAAAPREAAISIHAKPGDYHDTALYRTMVDNVAKGKGYYSTVGTEHRAHDYPTSPPQVFREPTLAWFLAVLRFDAVRTTCLFLLAAATMFQFYRLLLRSDLNAAGRVTFIAAASTGLGYVATRDAAYSHEVWASILLGLSLLIYKADRWWPSVAIAVLACVIRELALPFLFAMAACALFERKWREVVGWIIGVVIFAMILALHLKLAAQLYRSGDAISEGWFALGGWRFALETARFNVLLHDASPIIVAFLVSCGVIGLAGARDGRTQRAALTVFGYLTALTIVGRPGNYYWGILYTPILSVGLGYAPVALRDICRRAFPRVGPVPE
jgi:hypothetical protein